MNSKFGAYLLILFLTFIIGDIKPALAENFESKATNAVTTIILDYEAAASVSYRVNADGFVNIVFARNTPDWTYSIILNKLLHHPDIKGVLASKSDPNPSCSVQI